MGESEPSFSCASLLCQESEEDWLFETERDQDDDDDDESLYLKYYKSCSVLEDEDKYIEQLVQRETSLGLKTNASFSDYPTTVKNRLQGARLDAIEWIFNTRTHFGFQIHTAYLSVTYLDRVLSKTSIDDEKLWAIRLLSVSCLSLAAKMEECRVPVLSVFPTEDYQFESQVIQAMEIIVLKTLEWKMSCITPFAYLHYFFHKFYGESRPKGLVSKALEFIVVMIKEISLVDHRPSVVAAAALLAASDDRLTRKAMELKVDFISSWGSLEIEHVFSCYKMMQEIEMRKSKTPKFAVQSNYSSLLHGSIHPHDPEISSSPVSTTGAGTRRKIIFKESDQNSLAKKICRP